MTDLIKRETKLNAEPPGHLYELGRWHESRGHFEEALDCFKQGAINFKVADSSSYINKHDSALNWIEHGRLCSMLNKFDEASHSFKEALKFGLPYTSLALMEWSAMLFKQGIQDSDIYRLLYKMLSSYSISPTVLGSALIYIGAYKEAVSCFNMTQYSDNQSALMHARCLMHNGSFLEAREILSRLNHNFNPLEWLSHEDRFMIQHALLLCEWRLSGSKPGFKTTGLQQHMLARTLLDLGMITEAEYILSCGGVQDEQALISLLYLEGYIDLAEQRLQELSEAALNSNELLFIQAERLYDQAEYEQASVIFEKIRSMKPEHTNARFGEAACYLQSALVSLSSRITQADDPNTVKEQAMEYMKGINAALHIIENTKWHTSWTPAQQRRKNTLKQISLLN